MASRASTSTEPFPPYEDIDPGFNPRPCSRLTTFSDAIPIPDQYLPSRGAHLPDPSPSVSSGSSSPSSNYNPTVADFVPRRLQRTVIERQARLSDPSLPASGRSTPSFSYDLSMDELVPRALSQELFVEEQSPVLGDGTLPPSGRSSSSSRLNPNASEFIPSSPSQESLIEEQAPVLGDNTLPTSGRSSSSSRFNPTAPEFIPGASSQEAHIEQQNPLPGLSAYGSSGSSSPSLYSPIAPEFVPGASHQGYPIEEQAGPSASTVTYRIPHMVGAPRPQARDEDTITRLQLEIASLLGPQTVKRMAYDMEETSGYPHITQTLEEILQETEEEPASYQETPSPQEPEKVDDIIPQMQQDIITTFQGDADTIDYGTPPPAIGYRIARALALAADANAKAYTTGDGNNPTAHVHYNSSTQRLEVRKLTSITACLEDWFRTQWHRLCLVGVLSVVENDRVRWSVGGWTEGFRDEYNLSAKQPSLKLTAGENTIPNIVFEIGWTESRERMRQDVDLWLEGGAPVVKVVILVHCSIDEDERVQCFLEVYRAGLGVVQSESIFPRPPRAKQRMKAITLSREEIFDEVAPPMRLERFAFHLNEFTDIAARELRELGFSTA